MMDPRVKYLQTTLAKQCLVHGRKVVRFCSKLDCPEVPYMCQECLGSNAHPHPDKVCHQGQFLTDICQQIRNMSGSTWVRTNLRDLKPLSRMVQDALRTLTQFKLQIQILQSINHYQNPNILAYKLDLEHSTTWLQALKNTLTPRRQVTLQSQLNSYLDSLTDQIHNLKGTSVGISSSLPRKPETALVQNMGVQLQSIKHLTKSQSITLSGRKVYDLACVPSSVYQFFNKMLVCSESPPSLLYNLNDKTAIPINFAISLFSHSTQCFYAVAFPNTILEFGLNGVQTDQFSGYKQEVTSICCYQSDKQTVLATGYIDGTLQLYSKRSRLYSENRVHAPVINIATHLNKLVYATANGVVVVMQIKHPSTQYVFSIDTSLLNIQGMAPYSNSLLVWNDRKLQLFNLTSRLKVSEQSCQISDLAVFQSQYGRISIIISNQIKSYSLDGTIGQLSVQPLLSKTVPGRRSTFIHDNALWILNKGTTEIEVYKIKIQ